MTVWFDTGIGKSVEGYLALKRQQAAGKRTLYLKQISSTASTAVLYDKCDAWMPIEAQISSFGRQKDNL